MSSLTPPPLEKVAVIGCGYVGKAVACYWYTPFTMKENRESISPYE